MSLRPRSQCWSSASKIRRCATLCIAYVVRGSGACPIGCVLGGITGSAITPCLSRGRLLDLSAYLGTVSALLSSSLARVWFWTRFKWVSLQHVQFRHRSSDVLLHVLRAKRDCQHIGSTLSSSKESSINRREGILMFQPTP